MLSKRQLLPVTILLGLWVLVAAGPADAQTLYGDKVDVRFAGNPKSVVAGPEVELPKAGPLLGGVGNAPRWNIDLGTNTLRIDFIRRVATYGAGASFTFSSLDPRQARCSAPLVITGIKVRSNHPRTPFNVITAATFTAHSVKIPIAPPKGSLNWQPGDFIDVELQYGYQTPFTDCNGNGTPDSCDLAAGTSRDQNGNQVPDECDRNPQRTCATMELHKKLLRTDAEYGRRRTQIEELARDYVQRNARSGLRSGVFVIPVVVHVVYKNATQNISDAQIQSQIDALNQDFRRLNADAGSVPAPFLPVAADSRIEFRLAKRAPSCGSTNGITRTLTTKAPFSHTADTVKFAASGGHDAWPRDKYLNIWVAELSSGILGYAAFPGAPPAVDGVVIDYRYFGNKGTATAPYNLGRTATHEVGHWLNLFHIWGDDGTACTGSDQVGDTPNQGGANFSCPAFPHASCGNGPNGDMFMNYMDYTDDACMYTFTAGQSIRMDAVLAGPRASLAGSDALIPPPPVTGSDLWSQDTAADLGEEPNTASPDLWMSDDIWVRRQDDGMTNQEHQNPEYRTAGGPPNWIYVRVRNKACAGAGAADVELHWAKASTGLGWPKPWDGSEVTPALMGKSLGSQPTGSVAAGGFTIVKFPWHPPNPADFISFGADKSHFCLLSRIKTSPAAPFGMTSPEGPSLGDNVRNNNNIVWKNVTVVDELPGSGKTAAVGISNFTPRPMTIKLLFSVPREDRNRDSIFRWGQIAVDLGAELYQRWRAGGRAGRGVREIGGTAVALLQPDATLENLQLEAGRTFTIQAGFLPEQRQGSAGVLKLNVIQYEVDGQRETLVGGQTFVLKTGSADATLPNGLFRQWLHSREEDTGGIEVYRPVGFQFPPARSRTGFEIRQTGEFIDYRIGPTDALLAVNGRWQAEGNTLLVSFPGETGFRLKVISLINDVLRISREAPILP